MSSQPSKPMNLISIAASKDARLLSQWEAHLLPLQQARRLTFWSERHMLPGEAREVQIGKHLAQANIIVLLLSADFFSSEECCALMERALQRSRESLVHVVPLLLRSVAWHDTSLAGFSCLPTNERPVMSWNDRDEAFQHCVDGIRKLLTPPMTPSRHDSLPQTLPTKPTSSLSTSYQKDPGTRIDVCIVCALAEEAKAFLEVVEARCHISFTSQISPHYRYDYRLATIQNNRGEPLTLHVSWLPRYGLQEMALHLSHVVEEYHPRFTAMTGICAGDKRHVVLGDLVIAERTFTYDTGKFERDKDEQIVHVHDAQTYQTDENILRFVQMFDQWKPLIARLERPASRRQQREWLLNRLLHEQVPSMMEIPEAELKNHAPNWRQIVHELQSGTSPVLTSLMTLEDRAKIVQLRYGRDPFPYTDPPETSCHIKPLASGNAVRSDDPFQEVRIPVRGTIAIDMEGAAFCRTMARYPTIPWLIVKGISDYADQEKDDAYHAHASLASAHYMLCFLQEYLTNERFNLSTAQEQVTSQHPRLLPSHSPKRLESSAYHSCMLSYATEDQSFAEKLYTDLQQRGVSCWFAPHDLRTGEKIRDKIYDAIQTQDKLLLILSEHTVKSDWVEREVELAFELERQVPESLILFPIRLDDTVMQTNTVWAGDIRRIRFIGDFCQWKDAAAYQRALQRLLRDLHV